MFATIKAIVEAAKEAKCRVLILSAFGCGAYENLPREVAEMFYTVLTRYQKDFDTVLFCIKDDIFEYGDRPPHIPSTNFDVFVDVFRHKRPKATEDAGLAPAVDTVAPDGGIEEISGTGGLRLPEVVEKEESVASPDEDSGSELEVKVIPRESQMSRQVRLRWRCRRSLASRRTPTNNHALPIKIAN